MESLSINKEQREKLLEMCRVLFPEIKEPTIDGDGFINEYFHEDELHDWIPIVYWFEFCMTHLAKKVIPKYNINNTEEDDIDDFDLDYRKICFGYLYPNMEIHPIDFLYEIFKNSTQK